MSSEKASVQPVESKDAAKDKMRFSVYTDGSCWKGKGSWAYVLVYNRKGEDHIITGSGSEDETTSNRCEMLAVLNALERIAKGKLFPPTFLIHSDSQYTVNMFSGKWMVKDTTKNKDLIQKYIELELTFKRFGSKLKLKWIRGHNGNKYNEMADQLASDERVKHV